MLGAMGSAVQPPTTPRDGLARAATRGRSASAFLYPARGRFPGRLIAVEGIDGSGKSTQVRLLLRWLQAAGLTVHLTTWNSSPMIHRSLRRAKRQRTLLPATFSLMHAADLADRLERDILPRLHAGEVVLADRWVGTAFARDAARGCAPEWLRRVYAFAPRPHLTAYFRIPVDAAMTRILAGRREIRFYEAGLDLGLAAEPTASFGLFQQRVAQRYAGLVRTERMRVIDARLPVADQQVLLRGLVGSVLGDRFRGLVVPGNG